MVNKKTGTNSEEIALTIGEQRMGMKASAKCYFFYVSPTGREVGFKDCEFTHIAWMKGGREEDDGSRVSEMGLDIIQPITIKMASMLSQFGRPTAWKHLYIDLHPDAEKIEVVGLGPTEDTRFGSFIGRGTINEELSHMTDKEAQKIFKITTLAGPKVERTQGVRSLIIPHD